MRSRVESVRRVGLVLAFVLAGCLGEGRPWGELVLELGVRFEPPSSRLDASGRLKTANDFRVVLSSVEVELGPLELVAKEAGSAGFDPSAPPEGYSLCHNGHCHADDGRLVSYEDIAAELAGGGGSEVLVGVLGGGLSLSGSGRATRVTECTRQAVCEVAQPVTVGLVRVGAPLLRVRGRVFEGRSSAQRVPVDGLDFEVQVAGEVSVAMTGAWRFGPGERLGLSGAAIVEVPPSLFDAVEWDTMGEAAVESAVGEAWAEGAGLSFEVVRFD